MASSFTTNKTLEKPGNGDYVDTWNVPVNGDLDIIDQSFGGTTSLNATGGSATLTVSQYRSLIISVAGAMSANVVYTIPSGVGGQWIVKNLTTDSVGGPWTITFASAGGGSSVTVLRGYSTLVYSDGTNIVFVNATIIPAGSIGTAQLANGSVTYEKIDPAVVATASDFQSNVSNKVLGPNGVWSSGQIVSLTDGVTISLDLSSGFNFSVTLGGNRSLANPTNTKVGQSGIIAVSQDVTGGRTLSFGSSYKFANGVVPSPDTASLRVNVYAYVVINSTFILLTMQRGVR
jgi:hypothetical protein